MTRPHNNTFAWITAAVIAVASLATMANPGTQAERVQSRILKLGSYGTNPEGGVSRPGFSEADHAARAWIIPELASLGLEVRTDNAANIIARRPGRDNSLPAIAFGSHIDSVPNGGNYDGQAGVVASLEVMETLNDNGVVTRHPLELLIFVAEEDGLFGSAAMSGVLQAENLGFVTNSGRSVADGMDFLGGDSGAVKRAERSADDFSAFVELHIEQGPYLDRDKIDIGIVQGIVGIEEWDIGVTGIANHAGTTPMNAREDALLAASKLVVAINESVRETGGRLVGTVGEIQVHPGASNVVPGRVEMVLEMRDLDTAPIETAIRRIHERAAAIAHEDGVDISFTNTLGHGAALTDPSIAGAIQKASDALGYSSVAMPSGAGHDAQNMATRWPTGMIFVPSRNGISHSPDEFTSAEAIARGAAVLYETILLLDADRD